jgi:uncharacterized surface protein with fasciclin (FAS1) repeats
MSFHARLSPFASAFALASLMTLGACATSSPTSSMPANVVAAAAQRPELATFTKLVQQAGLSATLESAGPYTVFAPTDAAFKAVPAATLDKLAKDPEALKYTLTHHVLPGAVTSADVTGASSKTTVAGTKVTVSKAGDFVTVDDGLVTQADVMTGNGVLHIIDTVLTPPVKK